MTSPQPTETKRVFRGGSYRVIDPALVQVNGHGVAWTDQQVFNRVTGFRTFRNTRETHENRP